MRIVSITKKINYKILLFIFLGLFGGFFITIQFKTPSSRSLSPILSRQEIDNALADFRDKQNLLKEEIKKMREEVKKDQEQFKEKNLISSKTISELEEEKSKAGLSEISGEGVEIILGDGEKAAGRASTRSITHAADLRDIINLLWAGGAKAISINNQRITAVTSIDCIINTILINDTYQVPPFKILAISSYNNIKKFVSKKYLEDLFKRAETKDIEFKISAKKVTIPEFDGVFRVEFVKLGG